MAKDNNEKNFQNNKKTNNVQTRNGCKPVQHLLYTFIHRKSYKERLKTFSKVS